MAFGITKDIVGKTLFQFDLPDGSTVKELKAQLSSAYPKIEDLKSLLIAVNEEYGNCLLYTSPSPRDRTRSRMPSSA